MLFSRTFNIERDEDDDWFDPDLASDTRLFLDPMLIWEDDDPRWVEAHGRVVAFFNEVLVLVARGLPTAGLIVPSPHLERARLALRFPEPPEFCLGFGQHSIFGSGSGADLGASILDAAMFSVRRGITEISHFEELALFGEGIGADRISDIVCNILKAEFITYTQEVASRHDLPVERLRIGHVRWRAAPFAWVDGFADLPRNMAQDRRVGVLLLPERFLRELPTLEASEFWAWAWENLNQQVRADFGDDISRRVDSATIMKFARAHASAVQRFVREREEADNAGYNFDRDPKYFRLWSTDAPKLVANFTLAPEPETDDELCKFVATLCAQFKHGVEKRKHYELLWVGETLRKETHCQKLFDSTVFLACEASDVDVSPEANGGVGPVDFKFSRGKRRAIAELKLAKSSSLMSNLESQIPAYAATEKTQCAYVVIIQSQDRHVKPDFMRKVDLLVKRVAAQHSLDYKVVWVDARKQKSASKLRPAPS